MLSDTPLIWSVWRNQIRLPYQRRHEFLANQIIKFCLSSLLVPTYKNYNYTMPLGNKAKDKPKNKTCSVCQKVTQIN